MAAVTRRELKMRLWFSLIGVVALLGLWAGGLLPGGAGRIELLGLAGLFFAGSAVHAALRLRKTDKE